MLAMANTKISILRGTTTNAYGDEVDSKDPVRQGIPASIIERTRRAIDPVTGNPVVIVFYIGRIRAGTSIQITDRIFDESDNSIYAITNISQPKGPALKADMRLDLQKLNSQ